MPPQPQPQPPKNSSNTTLLVIIIVLLLLLLGVMAWLLWGDKIGGLFKGKEQPQEELVLPATNAGFEDAEADATIEEVPAPEAVEQEVAVPAEAIPAPATVEQAVPAAPPPVVRNRVANGTYRLNGAITHKQNYYIDMEIHVKGNQASGRYIVYNGENVYVTLSGSIDANGNMRLTEYKNGVATGYYFTGRFNQATYSGKYKCTNRKLTMNFSASTY